MSEQWGCRSHLGDEWCSGRADAEHWVDVRPGILISRIVSTWDCIDAATAHGIPVEIIRPKEAV